MLEASNLDVFGFLCGCFLPSVVSCFSATLVTVCSAAFLGGAFPFTTVAVETAVLDCLLGAALLEEGGRGLEEGAGREVEAALGRLSFPLASVWARVTGRLRQREVGKV